VANVTGYAGVLAKLNAQYSTATPELVPVKLENGEKEQPMFSQMGTMYEKRLKHKDVRSYSCEDLTAIMGGVGTTDTPATARSETVNSSMKLEDQVVLFGMFVRPCMSLSQLKGWGGDLAGASVNMEQTYVKTESAVKLEVKEEREVKIEPEYNVKMEHAGDEDDDASKIAKRATKKAAKKAAKKEAKKAGKKKKKSGKKAKKEKRERE
jgi:hypothetical protein